MTTWNEHKAMLTALEHGTATPGQQRAALAYIRDMQRQHAQEMRDERRDVGASVAPREPN